MWTTTLDRLLRGLIADGRLAVTWPDGRHSLYGPGGGPHAAILLQDKGIVRRLCLQPELALGEGYMDGRLRVVSRGDEGDALRDLLTILVRGQRRGGLPGWLRGAGRLRDAARARMQRNDARRARRNVAHHYDISDDLYRLFLDDDMQYSCAYFARPDMTLDAAQAAKKAHIARKLLLRPGLHVLDIGCGWGGLALTLARDWGVRVTGVTLSENQLAAAQARARSEGLDDRVTFRLMDYRRLTDRFDRIVSVGMFEHVGLPHYETYFGKVAELLAHDGVALVHTIGRVAPPSATNPWIARYIFPGGYVPSLSDVTPALERSGLWTTDIEVLRGHYGPTLYQWRQRFESRLHAVRVLQDDRFIRMFRFYLVACEVAFEEQHQAVFQMQLSHAQHAVPATRDYLYHDPGHGMLRAAE